MPSLNGITSDDLKLKEYLNSLQHLNFQIQYQRIELDKTIKINMPQQVQNQGYADNVLPLFNNFNYMEIKNDDYNKSYYYFIKLAEILLKTNKEMIFESPIERGLAHQITLFNDMVLKASEGCKPNLIADYLFEHPLVFLV